MKKSLLFCSALFLTTIAFSQDTIILRTNETVIAKITEVSPTTIRYKKFDMPDGPDFVTDKSTIKKIVYKNGEVEIIQEQQAPKVVVSESMPKKANQLTYIPNVDFIQKGSVYTYDNRVIGETRMYRLMDQRNDAELVMLTRKAKKAKGLQFIGFGAIPAAAYGVAYTIIGAISEQPEMAVVGAAAGVVAIGLATTGVVYNIRHKKLRAKAAHIYNEKY